MRQLLSVTNGCDIANVINVAAAEQESAMNEVIQECKMLHRLRHPNVTQLYGLWRGYDLDLAEMRVFMVLEFCGGGTLAEAVDMRDPGVR